MELAKELGVDKSTASRLVVTLANYDMVRLNALNKKYHLGFRILTLSDSIERNIDIISLAKPHMYKLSEQIGESVHICSVTDDAVYVIDQVRSKRAYSLSATIGMIEPWHCSAVGKCILAYKDESFIKMMLERFGMHRYTKNTIVDVDAMLEEVGRIREAGYAVDNEEIALGVRCIAAPIFKFGGQVSYSMGISGPTANITRAKIADYAACVVDICRTFSKELS